MITLKTLAWGNISSYGEDNFINLNKHRVMQLNGPNGVGKTSIGVILCELFTNKNPRGFKKAELFNRNSDKKEYWIQSTFDVDNIPCSLKLVRKGVKTTLSFLVDGEDVSSHRITDTYKKLEEILGLDAKTFMNLVYQSTQDSLDFLTATDAKRKEFLTSFLNLDEYPKYQQIAKNIKKERTSEHKELQSVLTVVDKGIQSFEEMDFVVRETLPLPEVSSEEVKDVQEKLERIKNNKRIRERRNKTLKEINAKETELDKLISIELAIPEEPEPFNTDDKPEFNNSELAEVSREKVKLEGQYIARTNELNKLKNTEIDTDCVRCGKTLQSKEDAKETLETRIKELEREIDEIGDQIEQLSRLYDRLVQKKSEYEEALKEYNKAKRAHEERWKEFKKEEERSKELSSKIRQIQFQIKHLKDNLEEEPEDLELNEEELQEKAKELEERTQEYYRIKAENDSILEYNEKAKIAEEKLKSYRKDKEDLVENISSAEKEISKLDILIDIFGPKGLIGYKIESSVREVEKLANKYLTEFSDGLFELRIRMEGSKLPVKLLNMSHEIGLHTLSTGQRAWVNISTLLALRKMLSSLSMSNINFLMLDEIAGVLDEESKEKLIQILLQEEDLNTITVAHSYHHPLVHQVEVEMIEGNSCLKV